MMEPILGTAAPQTLVEVSDLATHSAIKQFADSHLQETINAALLGVLPGGGGAIIDIDIPGQAVKGAVVQRVGDSLDIVLATSFHLHSRPDLELAIRKTWGKR